MEDERIIADVALREDDDLSLRPKYLDSYIGQTDIKEMLNIYIKAAKMREESLDHTLLYGPPGLGKTTLAQIIANELEVEIRHTSGPAIEKSGDLAAVLSSLEPGDVLFIDEIHRLPRIVEEVLYSAMEDFVIDIVIGQDSSSRSIRIELPPFTLIGATTRYGDLSAPLRERFGVVFKLDYYSKAELAEIIERTSGVYEREIDKEAITNLASRSRGTPRIANRLFRRIRDFADIMNDGIISNEICDHGLGKLGINSSGLDGTDLEYLKCLITRFNGGPVGIENIASTLSEEITTIEDVYEPYLLQEGYIKRTARGRVALEKAYETLGLESNLGLLK